VWGNLYHRRHEPNSGLNHVNVYLYTTAPSGRWRVTVRGKEVLDGRIHAWIERDASGRYQSRFPGAQASSRFTTNTICNCYRAIAVGAYDSSSRDRPPTRFSSRGPTADGRQKPEVAAPGFKVLAARSLPRRGWRGERRLVAKSGTSMAAPWVSGTVALMFAAAKRPLTVHEVRRALIGTVDPHPHPGPAGRTSTQLGYGYLNTAAAVAARRIGLEAGPGRPATAVANEHEPEALPEEAGCAPVWLEDAAEAALIAPSEADDSVPEPDPVARLRTPRVSRGRDGQQLDPMRTRKTRPPSMSSMLLKKRSMRPSGGMTSGSARGDRGDQLEPPMRHFSSRERAKPICST
jgi:hypothetical protein